jgi:ribosome-associated translation inhibitor RaiA
MHIEPQMRFRGMEPSPSVEEIVRERMDRLARFHDRITSCSVVIEAPHRHGKKGKIYRVHVDITAPGEEIVTGRGSGEKNHAHEDVHVAIRDSFDAAQRQLEDLVRRKSGYRVKPHPETLRGRITQLVPDEGYGFICRMAAISSSAVKALLQTGNGPPSPRAPKCASRSTRATRVRTAPP